MGVYAQEPKDSDVKNPTCERLSIFKPANAVTRSVPSSGRSSPTSTESTQLVPTTATAVSSLSASMSTTMRLPAASTFREPSLSTWSQVPWTLSDRAPLARSSDPTTLYLDRAEPVTTGPRDTTPRRPRVAIVCKDFSLLTLWAVEPDPAWELFSSPR